MINVSMEEGMFRYRLRIEGHSDYEAHGKDIVCASVSALSQSFVLYAQDRENDGRATVDYFFCEEGYLAIDADGDIGDGFSMLKLGLQAIAEQYPNYVNVGGEIDTPTRIK